MADRIKIIGDNGIRTPDPAFVARLRDFDKDLIVFWNKLKKRWVVEQCFRHAGGSEHSHLCQRKYVWLVQDADGDMMPLCDKVFDELRLQRHNSETFGSGPESLVR